MATKPTSGSASQQGSQPRSVLTNDLQCIIRAVQRKFEEGFNIMAQ